MAYDDLMRDSVRAAGDDHSLLVVQTNNATFGYTDESEQQFAISRIRAIEHGRSVVHVSTVGVSGFVAPDGTGHREDRVVHRRPAGGQPGACAPSDPGRPAGRRARSGSPPPPLLAARASGAPGRPGALVFTQTA